MIWHPYVSIRFISLCKLSVENHLDLETAIVHIGCDEMDRGAMSNNVGIGAMLLRWRCSVYKVVYSECIIFLILFGIISAVYRNGLDDGQKGSGHFHRYILKSN